MTFNRYYNIRRRKSSSGSTQLNTPLDEGRGEEQSQAVEMVRGDAITLSSVPQQRRVRDFNDERERMDTNAQQVTNIYYDIVNKAIVK